MENLRVSENSKGSDERNNRKENFQQVSDEVEDGSGILEERVNDRQRGMHRADIDREEHSTQGPPTIQSDIITAMQSKLSSFERQLESQNAKISLLKEQVISKDKRIEDLKARIVSAKSQIVPVQSAEDTYRQEPQVRQEDIDFWKTSEKPGNENYENMRLEDLIPTNELWITTMERQTPVVFNGSRYRGVKSNALMRQQKIVSHESRRLNRNPTGYSKAASKL